VLYDTLDGATVRTLVLDGLRPEREGVTPFPVAALRPDEMEMTMRQSVPRHH
jgi:hypothetical protein